MFLSNFVHLLFRGKITKILGLGGKPNSLLDELGISTGESSQDLITVFKSMMPWKFNTYISSKIFVLPEPDPNDTSYPDPTETHGSYLSFQELGSNNYCLILPSLKSVDFSVFYSCRLRFQYNCMKFFVQIMLKLS